MDSESTSGAIEPGGPDNQVEESKQVSARSSRPRIRKILLRIPWPQRKKRNKLVCINTVVSQVNIITRISTHYALDWDTNWEAAIK